MVYLPVHVGERASAEASPEKKAKVCGTGSLVLQGNHRSVRTLTQTSMRSLAQSSAA